MKKLLNLCLLLTLTLGLTTQLFAKNPIVQIKTSVGDVFIELYIEKAPISCKNFIDYAESGFYNGTIFHRVIKDFMIQGGGFTEEMAQRTPKAPIKNEATNGLSNERGTIAMARTSVVDSATSQFFINTVDNGFLNHKNASNYGYAVFGKVIQGMDTVDIINIVKTGAYKGFRDVPQAPVVIQEVKVLRK